MIRHLTAADFEIYRQIRLEALREDPLAFASYAADWQDLPDAEFSRRIAADDVFVSFDGDDPVGIMGIMPFEPAKMTHRSTIILVYLRKSHRGQGRAEALIRAVEDFARTKGLRQLELTVLTENPTAMRFYERMGYRKIGFIPAGFLHEGREMDEVLMMRRLTP
ncbi:MAG: RimJ/RimL family protein N-acetyltransferase [Paracoccaceae bacterium]|jgi:RimJ/RimL family protein N-acetyltransferase